MDTCIYIYTHYICIALEIISIDCRKKKQHSPYAGAPLGLKPIAWLAGTELGTELELPADMEGPLAEPSTC